MSTSSDFTGRIQARGQYDYLDESEAGEELLPGNLITPSVNAISKVGANASASGIPFAIVTVDLYQGTYGNSTSTTDQWDVPYDSGTDAVPYQMPKPGSRYWVRSTADDIAVDDLLQIEPSTGRVQPYGTGSLDGAIIGVARTANTGNEQSDSAAADDLILVQFS